MNKWQRDAWTLSAPGYPLHKTMNRSADKSQSCWNPMPTVYVIDLYCPEYLHSSHFIARSLTAPTEVLGSTVLSLFSDIKSTSE